jgi:DeoR family transcriptional regulator, aga operon transcriptional repressor
MAQTSQQRREQIEEIILSQGHVTVKKLVGDLGVSEATIRRDLRHLADDSHIELVYGGATLPRTSDFSFRSKSQRQVEAKRIIGRLASMLVVDGETMLLDSGTTTREMAPHLKRLRSLTVIVNSARLAVDLSGSPDMNIIMLGGHYRPESMDSIGPLATASLEQLRGFRAFIGADGLSPEFGVTASDIESAHLYRLAIRNSRETILMADNSKFLSPSLYKICEMEDISRIVTDKMPAEHWMTYLGEKGIELLCPENVEAFGHDDPSVH